MQESLLEMKIDSIKLLSRYSLFGIFILTLNLVITRLLFHNARLIRLPFSIKSHKSINFGSGFIAGSGLKIDCLLKSSSIKFGCNFKVGNNFRVAVLERVEFGNNVLIASNVFITDHAHGDYGCDVSASRPDEPPADRKLFSSPVSIGDNVWIGEGVVILKGAKIGAGCVVGAHSVVNGVIPNDSIVVGAPGRVVKSYDQIKKIWVGK